MEITQKAYQDLQNYILSNWKHIELQTAEGDKIVRLNTSDSRVTTTLLDGSLVFIATIKGTDSDIVKPVQFNHSAIFKTEDSTEQLSHETFTSFTMENNEDELTVTHTIQIPQKGE